MTDNTAIQRIKELPFASFAAARQRAAFASAIVRNADGMTTPSS
jgi:hypothetical protein